jgi:3-dehydroquinate dehydratase-1
MIGLAKCQKDNYDLEHFRSSMVGSASALPLITINTGIEGRFSRVLNQFLTPIKHPLLPQAASPSQLSVAEINRDLAIMGEIQTRTIYTLAFVESHILPPPQFFEKCLNELSLPYTHSHSQELSKPALAAVLGSPKFWGAVTHPPISAKAPIFAATTATAASTGFVDTIYVDGGKLISHNSAAVGIQNSLVREFTPSAYAHQPVLIVSHSFPAVASAIDALKSLGCGKIYTVGFVVPPDSPLADNTHHCRSLGFSNSEAPFAVISALEASQAQLLIPLIRLISAHGTHRGPKRMLLDIGNGWDQKILSASGILASGWIINTVEDVAAWTAVEMMKCLVGQSVPYDFLKMAGKKGFF